jgi:curved DNA-binding protein CbpA
MVTARESRVTNAICLSDYFKLFEIKDIKEVSLKQLKSKYKALALQYHPDTGGTGYKFRFIKLAYDYLLHLKKQQIKKESKKFFNTHLRFYSKNSIYDTKKKRWIRVRGKDLK